MGKIRDSAGRVIEYLPFDLRQGAESAVLVWKVTRERAGEVLVAAGDTDRASYWVRRTGSGDPFVDLSAGSYDLSGLALGVATDFDVKAKAANDIVGVERVSLSLIVAYQSAADFKG